MAYMQYNLFNMDPFDVNDTNSNHILIESTDDNTREIVIEYYDKETFPCEFSDGYEPHCFDHGSIKFDGNALCDKHFKVVIEHVARNANSDKKNARVVLNTRKQ